MITKRGVYILVSALLSGWLVRERLCLSVEPQWRKVPLKGRGVEYKSVRSFTLSRDGTPWAVLGHDPSPWVFSKDGENSICYLDGNTWHQVLLPDEKPGFSGHLHVSRNGEPYGEIVRKGRRGGARQGSLYRLTPDGAQRITRFDYDWEYYPALYFDKAGRIWNWTPRSLAKFEDGKWERYKVDFGMWQTFRPPSVIEFDNGHIYFFRFDETDALIYCLRAGKFGSKRAPMPNTQVLVEYERQRIRSRNKLDLWAGVWPR